jgi:hypothetical protein
VEKGRGSPRPFFFVLERTARSTCCKIDIDRSLGKMLDFASVEIENDSMEPTPPPLPQQKQRNWWQRNWKWFVPTGCMTLVVLFFLFIGAIMALVFGAMKSSDVYKTAVARAKADDRVTAALGTPIREGMFVSGSTNASGGSGEADLAIPLSGPKGKGKLYVVATKSAGTWEFSKLLLEVEGGEKIDLNEEETSPDSENDLAAGDESADESAGESSASIAAVTLARDDGNDFRPVKNFKSTETPHHLIVTMSAGNSGARVKTVWTNLNAGGAKNQKLWEKELVMNSPKPLADFSFSNADEHDFPPGDYKIDIYLNRKLVQTVRYKVQ